MNADQIAHLLPSASNAERLEHCPWSHKAALAAPPVPERDDAAAGTRMHHALETGDWSALSPKEHDLVDRCDQQCGDISDEFFGDSADLSVWLERRLSIDGFSGKADVVHYDAANKKLLIIDWKTGRGDYDPASGNRQLRALAVLWSQENAVTTLRVAIVQPLAGKPSVADFTEETLLEAEEWLYELLSRERHATEADAVAGAWCLYCPAKITCFAYLESLDNTFGEVIEAAEPVTKESLERTVTTLPAEKLTAMLDSRMRLTWLRDALEIEAKRRIEASEDIGYELKPGARNFTVTDAQKALSALTPLSVTTNDVLAACTVSLPMLRESVRQRSGGEKASKSGARKFNLSAKDAAEACESALREAGCLTEERKAPSLVKSKPQLES